MSKIIEQVICDRCNAVAYGKLYLPSGSYLSFCGHHMRAYEGVIKNLGKQSKGVIKIIKEK